MTTYTTQDKSEAKRIVNALNKSTYILAHGEYERPDYMVRKVRGEDLYEIFARYYFFRGTFYAKQSGAICEETAYLAANR